MKYDPLTAYLRRSREDRIQLSFSQLESILSFTLGKSPRNHRAWWANGGHDHAAAWMNAGYKVESVNLTQEIVVFAKNGAASPRTAEKPAVNKTIPALPVTIPPSEEVITVCGYPFRFAQEIVPKADNDVLEIYPELDPSRRLNRYGAPPFCRFEVKLPNRPGVYLWVVDGEIIYIGEAQSLEKRFYDYGHIVAANCYQKGRNTNCKMNKVVLEQARKEQYVKLYFHETGDYKAVELDLLKQINTKYNVKDNQ